MIVIIAFLILFLFPIIVNLAVKDPDTNQKLMKYYVFLMWTI